MKLQCEIQNVAPVQNVTVQWIKIHQNKSQEPVEEMSFGNFSFSGSPKCACSTVNLCGSSQHPECVCVYPHLLSITVHYKPTITQPSSVTVSVTRGDSLNLACLAHGNPSPLYVWTSPGHQNHTNSTLTINHIQPKHQGQYNCTAINGEGSDSVTVEVTVVEDYLPIIASCAAVAVVLLVAAFCIWYGSYYRHTHMGHYILKNLTSRRHNANVAHSDVDQSEL
ncbi:hypothetical protein NFI96_020574 [Prochilodus magdalenae]|nr:hypothetical protein NFI96_020574 [Prochilodus magdalenae]